jgi:hypothetical protein
MCFLFARSYARFLSESSIVIVAMAICHEIMLYVEAKYGFVSNANWITEVKELCNIPLVKSAPN